MLRDDAMIIPWDLATIVTSSTTVDCGPITLTFLNNADGTAIDSIFTDDRSNAPTSYDFTTGPTSDTNKA